MDQLILQENARETTPVESTLPATGPRLPAPQARREPELRAVERPMAVVRQNSELSEREVWDKVLKWVDENRGLIVRNAERIYAGYGPYDLEDFLQQATVAGFHAWKDCVRAGEPERFVAYLFVRFRREVKDEMAIRRDAPASLRPGDACLPPGDRFDEALGVRVEEGGDEHKDRRRELVWKALRWMTPKQRVAWLLAMGYLGHGEADAKEIGRALKIGRRAAARLLARGMTRAALCAAEENER